MSKIYYEQYLIDERSAGAIIKRVFQIIGLLHFIIALLLGVYFAIIYWVFLIIPLVIFSIGLVWGSLSYLFSKDYKYEFKEGAFSAYYKTAYGKYKLIAEGRATLNEEEKGRGKRLTNLKKGVIISMNDKLYEISPDTYLYTLLVNYED